MSPNRQDFIKSIKSDMFKEMISEYFDESMALYDLIEDRIKIENVYADGLYVDNTHEIISDKEERGIVFSIDAGSTKNAADIFNTIRHYSVSCYDHKYSIETELDKNKLHIKFKEEVSG